MRVLYHFPHINHHQNIYSVPQWNKVEACVMAYAYDANAQVLLTKESGVQGLYLVVLKRFLRFFL